jgi:hypothetical protein
VADLWRGQGPLEVDGDKVKMIFVELDIWYIVCPKRSKNAWEQTRRRRHIRQRLFCDLNVLYCKHIQMVIKMRELALLQAEVLNAASWALVSWQYQNGEQARAGRLRASERRRPTHTHHNNLAHPQRPFTALSCILCSWTQHLYLYRTARAIIRCTRHFC